MEALTRLRIPKRSCYTERGGKKRTIKFPARKTVKLSSGGKSEGKITSAIGVDRTQNYFSVDFRTWTMVETVRVMSWLEKVLNFKLLKSFWEINFMDWISFKVRNDSLNEETFNLARSLTSSESSEKSSVTELRHDSSNSYFSSFPEIQFRDFHFKNNRDDPENLYDFC